jgi:peroxiredoxin
MPLNRQGRAFRFLPILIAILCLAASAFAGAVPENKPGIGDAAPMFIINDLDGKKVSLEEIVKSGKTVFLNFWGLRCSACIDEIGYLNPLCDKFSPKGVVFLGVNVDGAKPDMIRQLMPNMPNKPKYTVLPDPEFKIPDMYNLAGAPLSFIISKDGVVKYRHEDFKPGDEKEMEEAIAKALAAK